MAIEHTLDTPLSRAVRVAGSQSAFARMIGRSQAYVYRLLRDGKELHPREAKLAEQSTGVSKLELCPDIFDDADAAKHFIDAATNPGHL